MNNKKRLLCAVIPFLTASFLIACNNNKTSQPDESEEPKPIEIGDTVKEWTSSKNSNVLPLGLANENSHGEIVNDFGNTDACYLSLYPEILCKRYYDRSCKGLK